MHWVFVGVRTDEDDAEMVASLLIVRCISWDFSNRSCTIFRDGSSQPEEMSLALLELTSGQSCQSYVPKRVQRYCSCDLY